MGYSCIVTLSSGEEWTERSEKEFFPLKNVFNEVIIVSPDHSLKNRLPQNFRRVTSHKKNRAHQYNIGAEEARSDFLCFVEHSSDFDPENFARLRLTLRTQTLHYFHFKFMKPRPKRCKFNEWIINTRADFFKAPFMNQSFSMDKKSFFNVGAFSERVIQNEDAEFVRRWKQKGYFISKANGVIKASPEALLSNGWLKSTAKELLWDAKYYMGKEPRELIPQT